MSKIAAFTHAIRLGRNLQLLMRGDAFLPNNQPN